MEFGIYTARRGDEIKQPESISTSWAMHDYTLVTQTDRIPLEKGLSFGTKYVVQGSPSGWPVTLTWVTRFPKRGLTNPQDVKMIHNEHPWGATIGKPTWRSYTFDHDWEWYPENGSSNFITKIRSSQKNASWRLSNNSSG
jgi:hypothetical protein